MEPEMADYIWNYHRSHMTAVEDRAWKHLWLTFKWPEGPYPNDPRERFLTNDPTALELVALEIGPFKQHVVERIWSEHGPTLHFNRCPKCNCVCRTPQAKLCRFCHHDWH